MKERIVSLDIAKAICIVLVVIGHYAPDYAPHWYVVLHDVIYTFHMPLFMFASGYIYIATKRGDGYGSFLMRKVRRLMVPYLATSFIVISFKLLSQGHAYVENPVTMLSYVRMFYLPEAGYYLWFIWALLLMFVIIPFFNTRGSRLVLFLVALLLHIVPLHVTSIFCIDQFESMSVYFMAGIVIYDYKRLQLFAISFNKYKSIGLILLYGGITSALVATDSLGSGKALRGGVNVYYILNVVLPFIGILFIMEVSKLLERVRSERLLNALLVTAASSYTIYLFHTTFMGFAKALCVRLPFDSDLWYVFVPEAVAVTCAGVAISMMLHYWVLKRYALTRTLFGL